MAFADRSADRAEPGPHLRPGFPRTGADRDRLSPADLMRRLPRVSHPSMTIAPAAMNSPALPMASYAFPPVRRTSPRETTDATPSARPAQTHPERSTSQRRVGTAPRRDPRRGTAACPFLQGQACDPAHHQPPAADPPPQGDAPRATASQPTRAGQARWWCPDDLLPGVPSPPRRTRPGPERGSTTSIGQCLTGGRGCPD